MYDDSSCSIVQNTLKCYTVIVGDQISLLVKAENIGYNTNTIILLVLVYLILYSKMEHYIVRTGNSKILPEGALSRDIQPFQTGTVSFVNHLLKFIKSFR